MSDDGRIQMYNLGGEYPELPSRLLAWADFCSAIAERNTAQAEARKLGEALRDFLKACEGIAPFNGPVFNGRFYRARDLARQALNSTSEQEK